MTDSIKYKKEDHIITRQKAAEEAMLAEFSQGTYTLQTPLVKLNCYETVSYTHLDVYKRQDLCGCSWLVWRCQTQRRSYTDWNGGERVARCFWSRHR